MMLRGILKFILEFPNDFLDEVWSHSQIDQRWMFTMFKERLLIAKWGWRNKIAAVSFINFG
jgi:hypothetical protein